MYPINNWKNLPRGYKFKEPTFYNTKHLGLDVICSTGIKIYAWKDLSITNIFNTTECGNMAYIVEDGSNLIFRIMHLKEKPKVGHYKKGSAIALVGNTGSLSTASHLHIDISKEKINIYDIGNFIDPELYFFKLNNMLELKIDNKGNQYLASPEDKIAFSIPDEEQLIEIRAFKDLGEPTLFDPKGWMIIRGGSENWWNSKLNLN